MHVAVGHFEQSIANLKKFEGCVPWMYRDAAGEVAVGVGLKLPNEATACGLPFVVGPAPANMDQIAAEFVRVSVLLPGKPPAYYKRATSPELPREFLDEQLGLVLAELEAILQEKLPNYDKLPDEAKMVLLDMGYDLGSAILLTEYPQMLDAIEIGSWSQAAALCERPHAGSARNAWARQELMSAVVATIRAGARAQANIESQAMMQTKQPGGLWGKMRKSLFGK